MNYRGGTYHVYEIPALEFLDAEKDRAALILLRIMHGYGCEHIALSPNRARDLMEWLQTLCTTHRLKAK